MNNYFSNLFAHYHSFYCTLQDPFTDSAGQLRVKCIEKERQALIKFKQGLRDNSGMLSTWRDDFSNRDCCKWRGVGCNKKTGNIDMIDLRGSDTNYLTGTINITLLIELHNLEYLDLSWNDFVGSQILEHMGSFSNLRYLNLSYTVYGGPIPNELGKLEHLRYLDLSTNFLVGFIPHELGNLSHLKYLYLQENSLSGAIPFQPGNLPMLQSLRAAPMQSRPSLNAVMGPSLAWDVHWKERAWDRQQGPEPLSKERPLLPLLMQKPL